MYCPDVLVPALPQARVGEDGGHHQGAVGGRTRLKKTKLWEFIVLQKFYLNLE